MIEMAKSRRKGMRSWSHRFRGIALTEGADAYLARFAAITAKDIEEAKSPGDFENQRRADQKLERDRVRTLDDMDPDEVRAIEKLYGSPVCATHERAGRRKS